MTFTEHHLEAPDCNEKKKPLDIDNFSLQKFDKNPKIKPTANDEEDGDLDCLLELLESDEETEQPKKEEPEDEGNNSDLDNLLDLMNDDDVKPNKKSADPSQRKKVLIKKDPKKSPVTKSKTPETKSKPAAEKSKSSISITKAPSKEDTCTEHIFTEKNTGTRLIKSTFKNEIEMNMRLMSDNGKFLKLSDVNRRATEIKEANSNFKFYSVFVLSHKTETKTSAKGYFLAFFINKVYSNLSKHFFYQIP